MKTSEAPLTVFIITGEHSGDKLGSRIIETAKERGANIHFHGIGGPLMQDQGLHSLFPLEDIAVMGISEILPKLQLIHARLNETVRAIEEISPDVVLSIDCPDFSLRIQKKLARRKHPARRMHYVAPTVWAWRPGRAEKIAKYLDDICCLYPFEPNYFRPHGLKAHFVGHPSSHSLPPAIDKDSSSFLERYGIDADIPLVGLYPGSRKTEINRNISTILRSARLLKEHHPKLHFIIPCFEKFKEQILHVADDLDRDITYVHDQKDKDIAMHNLSSAIAVNGTIGLELAMAGVPHISCYKTSPFSYWLAKMMVRLDHIHLINILADHKCLGPDFNDSEIVPEFIQSRAVADEMAREMEEITFSEYHRQYQKSAFGIAQETLSRPEHDMVSLLLSVDSDV